jgi:hypothetical protein
MTTLARYCSECARPLEGRRDKLTCSGTCRVRRTRRLALVLRERLERDREAQELDARLYAEQQARAAAMPPPAPKAPDLRPCACGTLVEYRGPYLPLVCARCEAELGEWLEANPGVHIAYE